jgi:hypothetical protein
MSSRLWCRYGTLASAALQVVAVAEKKSSKINWSPVISLNRQWPLVFAGRSKLQAKEKN